MLCSLSGGHLTSCQVTGRAQPPHAVGSRECACLVPSWGHPDIPVPFKEQLLGACPLPCAAQSTFLSLPSWAQGQPEGLSGGEITSRVVVASRGAWPLGTGVLSSPHPQLYNRAGCIWRSRMH